MSIYIYILYIITLIVIISSLFYIKKYKKKEEFNNIDINIKSYVINLDYRIDRKKKFINDYNLKTIKYEIIKAIDKKKRDIELTSIQLDYDNGEAGGLPVTTTKYWSSLTGPIEKQWNESFTGAPIHEGAQDYYKECGYIV